MSLGLLLCIAVAVVIAGGDAGDWPDDHSVKVSLMFCFFCFVVVIDVFCDDSPAPALPPPSPRS